MAKPKIGDQAPAVSLLDQKGEKVTLGDFKGKNVVLYFYPKALTPGCTVQACGIRDFRAEFKKLKTVVFGVSPDAPKKLAQFDEKHSLDFTLLSDPEHKTAGGYGVWGKKKFMGREYMGVHRVSFIIDGKGKVRHIIDKVDTKTHNEDVATFIRENLA